MKRRAFFARFLQPPRYSNAINQAARAADRAFAQQRIHQSTHAYR